jgi:hypothetical protein
MKSIVLKITLFILVFSCKSTQQTPVQQALERKINLNGFYIRTYYKPSLNYSIFVVSEYDNFDSFLYKGCLHDENSVYKTRNFYEMLNDTVDFISLEYNKFTKKTYSFILSSARDHKDFFASIDKHYDSVGNLMFTYKRFKNTEFIVDGYSTERKPGEHPTYELNYNNKSYKFYSIDRYKEFLIW